jgi:hypothetical protein
MVTATAHPCIVKIGYHRRALAAWRYILVPGVRPEFDVEVSGTRIVAFEHAEQTRDRDAPPGAQHVQTFGARATLAPSDGGRPAPGPCHRDISCHTRTLVAEEPDATADVRARVEQAYGCEVATVLPHADEMMALASAGLFALRYPQHPITAALRQVVSTLTA